MNILLIIAVLLLAVVIVERCAAQTLTVALILWAIGMVALAYVGDHFWPIWGVLLVAGLGAVRKL